MERYLEFRVESQFAEIKIESFLKRQAGLTRRQISQAKFRPDGITKNGTRCRVTESVSSGDVIRICLEEADTASAHLEDFRIETCTEKITHPDTLFSDLDILYEDDDLLAVNKPTGMVTHPTGMHYADSLSNLVAAYFRRKNEQVCVRPVGRLDQETSGIVIFAKNQVAASKLQSPKSPSKIHKQYLAVVSGYLPTDFSDMWHTLDSPLMQDPENHLKMKVADRTCLENPSSCFSSSTAKIKTAITHYHTLFSSQDWSLITLRLETGRTHQIRVHMASIGHPLLGDTLYQAYQENTTARKHLSDTKTVLGCKSDFQHLFQRAALHAWRVSFQHPFQQKLISLKAPLPEDFRNIIPENLDVN